MSQENQKTRNNQLSDQFIVLAQFLILSSEYLPFFQINCTSLRKQICILSNNEFLSPSTQFYASVQIERSSSLGGVELRLTGLTAAAVDAPADKEDSGRFQISKNMLVVVRQNSTGTQARIPLPLKCASSCLLWGRLKSQFVSIEGDSPTLAHLKMPGRGCRNLWT